MVNQINMGFARAPFSYYQVCLILVELEVGSPFLAPPTTSSHSSGTVTAAWAWKHASGLSSIVCAKGCLLLLRQAAGLICRSLAGLRVQGDVIVPSQEGWNKGRSPQGHAASSSAGLLDRFVSLPFPPSGLRSVCCSPNHPLLEDTLS